MVNASFSTPPPLQNYTLVQAGSQEMYGLPNNQQQVVLAYAKKKTLAKIAPMPSNRKYFLSL